VYSKSIFRIRFAGLRIYCIDEDDPVSKSVLSLIVHTYQSFVPSVSQGSSHFNSLQLARPNGEIEGMFESYAVEHIFLFFL
jgi:hypothetical protein